jgi:hypothetical protein
MEELIRQAFMHVEVIGPHVADGHYDLIGPNGEIILPQVWETMIEPDWSITMHMWPMPEPAKGPPGGPPGPPPGHHFDPRRASSGHTHRHRSTGPPPGPPPGAHRVPPPPPGNWQGGPPRPGPPPGPGPGPNGPPVIVLGGGGGGGGGGKSKSRKESSKTMLGWMAGKPVKSGKGLSYPL